MMTDESALIVLQKDRAYMKTSVNYDLAVKKSVEALKLKPILEQENRRLKGAIKEYCEQNCEYAKSCDKFLTNYEDFLKAQFCDECPLGGIV